MNPRNALSPARPYKAAVLLALLLLLSTSALPQSNHFAANPLKMNQAKKHKAFSNIPASTTAVDARIQKLDPYARMLMRAYEEKNAEKLRKRSNIPLSQDDSGRLLVDLFIQLNDPSDPNTLSTPGIEIRTRVADILIARAPVDALFDLAMEQGVRRVEVGQKLRAKLDSSRIDIGADMIHLGTDLPQPYKGEDVIVGIVDHGIDFRHPDFNDQNGSRVLYLLEFLEGGGQLEWTKSMIDSDPASVTQIDGNGGGGHGTHVAGIAAGGGRLNSAFTGIAPASDIIAVKAIRDLENYGGFVSTDVVAACQYIFDKAGQMGKPAVVNISIGGHSGPHDGTSLYEQALTGLIGPGRLIVSSAGNEGDDFIHAGGISRADVINESIIIPDASDQRVEISLWYDPGVISEVTVFAYDAQFNVLRHLVPIPMGVFTEPTPMVLNGDTLGVVVVDAETIEDPNNGDGNVIFIIYNGNSPTIDITNVIWSVASRGTMDGRMDLWVITGGSFSDQVAGFPNETEMPGNGDYSVGVPATAQKVISVGSYTTKNDWFDIDGNGWILRPLPTIHDISASSSRGPTRDGRMAPKIAAPGQIIFSALSGNITEGVGYDRIAVLQGGGYLGKKGTSAAAPHVAGALALMLQVKSDLTYEEALQVLSETGRTNQFTGSTPNNSAGFGYLDAYAMMKKTIGLVSSVENTDGRLPESFVLRQNYPNPFNPSTQLEYSLIRNARAVLKIYNAAGRVVRTLVDKAQTAGTYQIQWDGKNEAGMNVTSGIYYARLIAGQQLQTRKMILLR